MTETSDGKDRVAGEGLVGVTRIGRASGWLFKGFSSFLSVVVLGVVLNVFASAIVLPKNWTTVIQNIDLWALNNLPLTGSVGVILLLLTVIFGLLSRSAVARGGVVTARQEKGLKRRYLKRVTQTCELLTLRGVPAGLIAESVRLDEVFITMELRPNRPRTDYPLTDTELAYYRQGLKSGTFSRDQERAVIDAEHNWQYILKQTDRISIGEMWSQLSDAQPAAVIQGYPGMGKSTLVERLALHMARRGLGQADKELEAASFIKVTLTPILLSLARYAATREKSAELTVLDYLQSMLHEMKIPEVERVVQQALKAGECLVIFDGLDEVSDPRQREGVQTAIRNFIQEQRDQPGNRFLITSRVAGYDTAAFPDYLHYTLAELTEAQIDDFLPRWCRASLRRSVAKNRQEEQEAEEGREQHVERMVKNLKEALRGNQGVRELAENPLLLTLLVVMQQNSIVLPRQRVELYRVVTTTLLENRNIAKGLEPIPELQAIQRLGPLAFQMQQTSNSFAREKEVLDTLVSTISGGGSEEKRQEAERFLRRIRERGGLFVQRTGDYFGFMHRTFQEYFAARYVLNQMKVERKEWIQRLVGLVNNDITVWREPFLLAVAYQSGEDEVVASEMLETLLDVAQQGNAEEQERNLLLAVECVIEAKTLAITSETEKRIALALLSSYETALREHENTTCDKIEDSMRSWLLSLPGEAYHPVLHTVLLQAFRNSVQEERQYATLMLLALIVQRLKGRITNLFEDLIPILLAISGQPEVGRFQPTEKLTVSQNLRVAELALSTLCFMDEDGPAGLMLAEVRTHFAEQPEQLRLLARYSLEQGTLLTLTAIPYAEENYRRYKAVMRDWEQLHNTKKRGAREEESCITLLQELLASAETVQYPASRYLLQMLKISARADKQTWQQSWQDYLIRPMGADAYIDYQECILLWMAIFPQRDRLQHLAKHLNTQFMNKDKEVIAGNYAQIFIAAQIYFDVLRSFRTLHSFRDFSALHAFHTFRDFRDLHNLRDFGALHAFSTFHAFHTFLFIKDVSSKALNYYKTAFNSVERVDLLNILTGRLLQIVENEDKSIEIEQEVQQIVQVAIDILNEPMKSEEWWAALGILRALPARTSNEIRFLLQLIEKGPAKGAMVQENCISALRHTKPDSPEAWVMLGQEGVQSKIIGVREAIEEVIKGRDK